MRLLTSLLDFFSPDHRYRDEVREWTSSARFPDSVVRTYTSRRVQKSDIRRMQSLGYHITSQEELHKSIVSGDAGFGGPAAMVGCPPDIE